MGLTELPVRLLYFVCLEVKMWCGPGTIQHICLDHLGVGLEDRRAQEICLLNAKEGVNALGMANAFREIGLENVAVYQGTLLDDLGRWRNQGAIVAVAYLEGGGRDDGHWSCVEKATSILIKMYDPDVGYRDMPARHFLTTWYDYDVDSDGNYILCDSVAVVGCPGASTPRKASPEDRESPVY